MFTQAIHSINDALRFEVNRHALTLPSSSHSELVIWIIACFLTGSVSTQV